MTACRRGRVPNARLVLILLIAVLCGCRGELAERASALPSPASSQEPPAPSISRTIEYEVRERLSVVNKGPGQPSKQNLWLALIREFPPYQAVHSIEITPDSYQLITDELGNRYAEFDLVEIPPGTTIPVEIRYRVAVNELVYDLDPCEGELPDLFNQAELHIESNNPQIIELAQQLSEGRTSTCEQVRAFYDYIGNNLVYSYNGANWGAQAALGHMGADCTEYASLMIALSRAEGIPARYLEGLWMGDARAKEAARTEHAWLDVYLPGIGWTPMDPTLGRSSLSRDEHFARYTPDHIVVTVGRNPSTLRGSSYWTYLYWPGKSTEIRIEGFEWEFTPVEE
jgi:transglutaminase-like putative cysteine protease